LNLNFKFRNSKRHLQLLDIDVRLRHHVSVTANPKWGWIEARIQEKLALALMGLCGAGVAVHILGPFPLLPIPLKFKS